MRLTRSLASILSLSLAVVMVGTGPAQAAPTAVASARPGDLLDAVPSVFHYDPVKVTTPDARVQRLTYVSTGFAGERTTVSATLITPRAKWSGPGSRPLIAYAPGTQGMDERCAPSTLGAAGSEYEGLLAAGLIARGYQVVMTDYEGLGTAGDHPYVNATTLGRNVLDSARAARQVATDATPATSPVFVVGYSEGGNAAAGALEQAASYAPDVNLRAGYAGAVPANLAQVAPKLDGSLYAAFLLYAIMMVDRTFPDLQIRSLISDKGLAELARADRTCLVDGLAGYAFKKSSSYTKDGSSLVTHLARPDIAAALETLRLGKKKVGVPVLVGHSLLDDVVPYDQGRDMARNWCRLGSKVRFSTTLAPTHVGGAVGLQPELYAFLEARTRNLPFIANCGWF